MGQPARHDTEHLFSLLEKEGIGNPALFTELIRGLGDDKAAWVNGDRAVLGFTQLP